MRSNRDNLKWLGRMALIIISVGVVDILIVAFAAKPLPWVVIVPALAPLLTVMFIIVPMLKSEKSKAGRSPAS